MGGEDVRVSGEQVGQPVRGGVLLVGKSVGVLVTEQVGAPGGPNRSDPPENTPTEASTPAAPTSGEESLSA